MITLFDQNRKYYNQNNKILHLVSHMTLQTAALIGTMEPRILFEVVLVLLTVGNFEMISNFDKILVRVLRFNICDRT